MCRNRVFKPNPSVYLMSVLIDIKPSIGGYFWIMIFYSSRLLVLFTSLFEILRILFEVKSCSFLQALISALQASITVIWSEIAILNLTGIPVLRSPIVVLTS
jgi:hypothetical protein